MKPRPKVLGIGLSRTGTTSLHSALEILGLRSIHWLTDYRHLHRYDSATDSNIAFAYKTLDILHPGSKFILTLRRDTATWIESMLFMHRKLQHDRTSFDGRMSLRKIFTALYGRVDDWDPVQLQEAYWGHLQDVLHYFRHRPDDLLEMDITAGDGWEKLCPFLGRAAPNLPFPHSNTFHRNREHLWSRI